MFKHKFRYILIALSPTIFIVVVSLILMLIRIPIASKIEVTTKETSFISQGKAKDIFLGSMMSEQIRLNKDFSLNFLVDNLSGEGCPIQFRQSDEVEIRSIGSSSEAIINPGSGESEDIITLKEFSITPGDRIALLADPSSNQLNIDMEKGKRGEGKVSIGRNGLIYLTLKSCEIENRSSGERCRVKSGDFKVKLSILKREGTFSTNSFLVTKTPIETEDPSVNNLLYERGYMISELDFTRPNYLGGSGVLSTIEKAKVSFPKIRKDWTIERGEYLLIPKDTILSLDSIQMTDEGFLLNAFGTFESLERGQKPGDELVPNLLEYILAIGPYKILIGWLIATGIASLNLIFNKEKPSKLREVVKELASASDPEIIASLEKRASELEVKIEKVQTKLKELKKPYDLSKVRDIHILTEVSPYIPTGSYHLLDREEYPLVTYKIANDTQESIRITLSSWIEGYSDHANSTIKISLGENKVIKHSPNLIPCEVSKISEVRTATLHTEVDYHDGGWEPDENSYNVKLYARDTFLMAIRDEYTNEYKDFRLHIAAWVTPNIEPVREMLRIARDYYPEGFAFGYPDGVSREKGVEIVRRKIEAIYQALQEKGELAYIDSLINFGEIGDQVTQRVKLPRESLKTRSVNCLDCSVLFASLIEAAGMNPAIVFVPGHAFLAWEVWPNSERYECLETMMIGSSSFKKAWEVGQERYKAAEDIGRFDRGVGTIGYAVLVPIKEAREIGIEPMPWA